MADAVISVIVDQVVSRSLQKIEEEVKLVTNAKIEVNKLKKHLRLVQALLEDAGKKQVESASVRQWLSDLEEVSYDMDDLLGDWNAAILQSEIEREAITEAEKKKVDFRFPFFCFCFKQSVTEVISLRQFSKKIKELNEELDGTKWLGNKLGIVGRVVESSDQYGATNKPRITTTSFVDETKIQGRVQDKAVLVSKLVCESSGNGKGIEIVPIVGMGGLGKTTLAQLAYNDDRVKAHFNARIWVCVSDPFDLFKVANAVAEGLGGNPQSYKELEALMQFISTSIEGKRFLMVLDDVWSRDRETWDQLIQPLQNGSSGSRILVTTRNKEVAMMMGVSLHNIDTLETLSDEECWSIIKKLSLVEEVEEGSNEFTQLEAIGKNIAAKCKGLPLPAKILGGLMCFKKSKKQWEDILHSQLWESKAFDKIFAPFLLSYYNLSPVEKCCFSYCSVFPKDQVIEVEMLIEMWMSQGYFDESSKGRDCFETLVMRSFFQDFRTGEDYSGYSCKMHDIVHNFAQYLTRDKFTLLEEDTVREKIVSLDGLVRHLTMALRSSSQFPRVKPNEMKIVCKLRSLYVVQTKIILDTNGIDFLNLPCFRTLRTLYIESSSNFKCQKIITKFPTMLHLRFLDLSRMYELQELPESLCDLCNLETLRLISCHSLQRLPSTFGKLVNLRHLYILECFSLPGFPKGFEELIRLQKLDALVVPENKESYFDASELRKLRRLQFQGTLTLMQCRNFTSADEAKKLSIETMEDIVTLNLVFGDANPSDIYDKDDYEATILEALKPHINLKSMLIWYYKGITMSPTWLPSLANLKYLRIMDCGSCDMLPPLGRLPSLESLIIEHLPGVKKVGPEFLGIDHLGDVGDDNGAPFVSFPRLKKLFLDGLENWKEWEGKSEEVRPRFLSVMPSLSSLTIRSCKSLEALPDFLLKIMVKTLSIDTGNNNLVSWCREGAGKVWLEKIKIRQQIAIALLIQNAARSFLQKHCSNV